LGSKAKGDMAGALEWFNSMGSTKQKRLMEMATGAAGMTKDAVAVLMTTVKEYEKVRTLVSWNDLSKVAQLRATDTIQKAQELYTSVMNAASTAPSQAVTMANLKREEFLASRAVLAVKAWAEATKKALEESAAVKAAREVSEDALKLADKSWVAALISAEEKRVEAIQLSSVYLAAAQERMVALSETEQGKKLKVRTQKLLEMTRQKTAELQEEPLVKMATEQLEANYKLAWKSVQAAQDWVAAVLGYQREEKPAGEQVVARQNELVSVLEKGVEGVKDI